MSLANSDFEEVGFDDGLNAPMVDEGYGATSEEVPVAPPPPQYRKQGFSIYTVMLIMSFVFLIASIIMLFMEVDRFSSP